VISQLEQYIAYLTANISNMSEVVRAGEETAIMKIPGAIDGGDDVTELNSILIEENNFLRNVVDVLKAGQSILKSDASSFQSTEKHNTQ
jgi:hypothetical protein